MKPAATGKSRLAAAGVDRTALARAIARDTIDAAARTPGVARVIVVSDDADAAATIPSGPGATVTVLPDPGGGLNAAIAAGLAGHSGPRAALLGDLPALRPSELATALRRASTVERAVVPDAEGTGSTLVTAAAGVPWDSAFGADSFARHERLGAVPVRLPPASGLRRDIDTAAQLRQLDDLGAGPRTTALLRAARAGSSAPPATARLRLRELREDDLDDMAALLGDPGVMRFYAAPRTRAQAAEWIARSRLRYRADGFGLWCIEDADGRFVGDCGLTWQPLGERLVLEVGYHVTPSLQGRGFAAEAASASRDLARTLGFTELRALVHPGNAASVRVAGKVGMHRDAADSAATGITVMRMAL
ncbi:MULTISPECIES: 2-phospho-L-lactate guanylyltransferase [unclassified Microbacterium]|uniref:2-phospho-L-lactate guanylyltransferase n=1 Tax=unclassified Microbacterium TaxID=2609290 RepID=UPI00214BF806|nr:MULTISPECIES: 2-phospho-L-lactate guanylyltransferase [unclassified Microbacterium]MCR2783334.1 2-phospho-L-lactate guanylyltransferase [Microbacterium sp. zg.B96]WIM15793.1 2-phospho-L-lactate guanylyltransferase [Microbacterium sp. zg-B96]